MEDSKNTLYLLEELKRHDYGTYIHSKKVEVVSEWIRKAAYPKMDKDIVKNASALHDIGKLKIDATLLNKKEPLTELEVKELKKHCGYGQDVLMHIGSFHEDVVAAVLMHHIDYNGYGYPDVTIVQSANIYAQIIRIADSFVAMIEKRSYKEMLKTTQAWQEILKGSGTMYHPYIVSKIREELNYGSNSNEKGKNNQLYVGCGTYLNLSGA